jgi:hypothetical protein
MFLFDPTQDPRFREKCKPFSQDPQVLESLQTNRQETILAEAANRVRKHRGLSAYERYDKPLLVLVAKSDIWAPLLNADVVSEPILPPKAAGGGSSSGGSSLSGSSTGGSPSGVATVDVARIDRTSALLRELLLQLAPEIVTVAEDFSAAVTYIPVSALGHSPQRRSELAGLHIKPRDIHPHWVTAPVLYTFARWQAGLISAG